MVYGRITAKALGGPIHGNCGVQWANRPLYTTRTTGAPGHDVRSGEQW